ncbi:MAG: sugar ABC transporter permease [Ruminococcaceae bacterium]|nr:sugar ABC transporter permease [Oscillospiraceae bacterium]
MKQFFDAFVKGDFLTKISFFILGFSNILKGQIIKGLLFLFTEIAYFYYMFSVGFSAIKKLRYLGTVEQSWVFDESKGIDILQPGDNSMLILLYGVFAIFITLAFVFILKSSVVQAYELEKDIKKGRKPLSFMKEISEYTDSKLHTTLLFLPILGVVVLTVLPLVFMILIAFTNFDRNHQPPGNLFTWIGIENFKEMLSSGSVLGETFFPVLGWTLVWAVLATALNYILGMLLAMLINKKGIKIKGFYRTIFILSIAIPQFVSLLVMRNILDDDGPLNVLLQKAGIVAQYVPFLTDATLARITVLVINLWIGIPYTMLITTGILMNIPEDLYESAKIDGATPVTQFFRITLPYVFFVTAPYLITQFIGNINNFNIIYFLTRGGPATLDYYQAGKTDLLVTWLYKLTVNSKDYSYAATIGILVFIISAVFSLLAYRRTSSYKNEEEFS